MKISFLKCSFSAVYEYIKEARFFSVVPFKRILKVGLKLYSEPENKIIPAQIS